MTRLALFLTMVATIFFSVAACADSDKDTTAALLQGGEQCETILQTSCVQCHQLARICQKVGDKDKKSWLRTISRMVNKGARLSNEEQAVLADCLASQAEGVKKACK